ncbi:hypothetical protein [Vulgatibacter incomptus]|uniref:hypothetical protein n=1 Tax=Vulgatibacter incomptus TaxID=1391653 RepID=UPI0012F917FA|nr:hypothetical protein [Vulgatibacter incomptus]
MRLLVVAAVVGLAMAACGGDKDPLIEVDPVCPHGCGPNMVCQRDGSCACAPGFLNCDGDAANGCEYQGDTCEVACTGESDAAFCARLNKNCGEVSAVDNCGAERTAACGTCSDGEECRNDNRCYPLCLEETEEAFCARRGKTCGSVTAKNNCDRDFTTTCGTCLDGQTCGDDNTCHTTCDAESDEAFCARLGKDCGDVTGDDNCGDARTVACGTCQDGQICGDDNVCSCEAEDNAAFCDRLAKNCGNVTDADNCGDRRTVSCGTCPDGETCGAEVANVCGVCEAEDDEAMCTRLGKQCGTLTSRDNCGDPRSIDCGGCDDGLLCASNLCCQPEDDATFCSRQSKNCGSFASRDNCGQTRTVDCGTCTGGQSCGGQIPNVCSSGSGCVPESDADLCLQAGAACGKVQATDSCGNSRTVVNCGSCTGDAVCMGNSCMEPDGPWLSDFCAPAWGLPCASQLRCVIFDSSWGFGSCKQLCSADADCTAGGACALGFLDNGMGICGSLRSPGDSCADSWAFADDVCVDSGGPAGGTSTALEAGATTPATTKTAGLPIRSCRALRGRPAAAAGTLTS